MRFDLLRHPAATAALLPTIIPFGNTRGRRVARFLFNPIRYLNSLSDNYYEMMENSCGYGVSVLFLQELLGETSTSRVCRRLIADQENNVCASALNFDHVPEENSATCLLVRGLVWQETTREQPAAARDWHRDEAASVYLVVIWCLSAWFSL